MSNTFKWFALGLGAILGIGHIGMIGLIATRTQTNLPDINLPVGDYTSYKVEAGQEGYSIEYSANDPKVMSTKKYIDKKNGFFGVGGKSVVDVETEYTMEGSPPAGGGKKLSAKALECIKAEGGGEQTGRIVGASIGASASGFVTGIPFVGPVLAGFVALFGADQGAQVGGELATSINHCEELDGDS